MADGDNAGGAKRRSASDLAFVEEGDAVSALGQVVGTANADDSGADDDGMSAAHRLDLMGLEADR